MDYKRSYSIELDFDEFNPIKTDIKFKQYDRGTSEIVITPLKGSSPMVLSDEIVVMMYKTKKEIINKVKNTNKFNVLNDSKSKYSDKYRASNEPDYFEEVITYSTYLKDEDGKPLKTKGTVLNENEISIIVDSRVLNEVGNIQAELVLYSNQDDRITSPSFDFNIIASIGDDYMVNVEPSVAKPTLTDEGYEIKTHENVTILSI